MAIPGALPGFFTGLRLAVTISWTALVVVEQVNATSGIGYLMTQARLYGQLDVVVVGLLVYAVFGLTGDYVGPGHREESVVVAARTGNLTEEVAVVRQLSRSFGGTTILDAVDLTIRKGEFVALLGRSGSGKSTLLRALAGLDHGVAGTGDLFVARDVSVVFQDSRLLPWARVLDNVALGLSGREVRTTGRHGARRCRPGRTRTGLALRAVRR